MPYTSILIPLFNIRSMGGGGGAYESFSSLCSMFQFATFYPMYVELFVISRELLVLMYN